MTLKRFNYLALAVLAAVCLFTLGTPISRAQAQTGGIQAQQTASNPLQLRITDGDLTSVLGNYAFKATNVLLVANATNYVFLDLSTTPPTLTVNQTGFPTGKSIYQIATAVTGTNSITSLADSRPTTFNPTLSSGGGITQVSSLPATCTAGTSQPVSITGPLTVGGVSFGAGTVFYCDSTNHYSPVSQGSGASPIMAFYLSSSCPPSNSAQCFNTPANTQQANDCAWTSGQADINCNTAHFVAADVGKRAFGYKTCMASVNLAANSNNGPITTGTALTIATFVSATHVTLSGNAANTVTVSGSFPQGGCFIWGTPDDTGAAAVDAAMQLAPFCPKLDLASAYYMFTTFHFVTNPPACAALGTSGGSNYGNIVYNSGFEMQGRCAGCTVWFMPPGFPESGSCTNGKSAFACWVIPLQGKWHDFQMTGGGNRLDAAIANNENIIEMDGPAQLQDFVGLNFGERVGSSQGSFGVAAYGWAQLNHVNLSAFGTSEVATNTSSSVTAIQLWIENFGTTGINVGKLTDYFTQSVSQFSKYNFICYDCTVGVESLVDAATVPFFLVNNGLNIKWIRGGLSLEPGTQTQNNTIGYDCTVAGCVFDVQDAFLDLSQPAAGTGNVAIQCASVACTNYIANTVVKGSSSGSAITDGAAGSVTYDLHGNTIGNTNFTGTYYADGHSLKANCTGVATASSTLALVSSGVSLTGTGLTSACTGTTLDKGISVQGARTLQNLICTSSATTVSVACTVMTSHNGGAFAASAVTCTMTAATRCTDGTHSLTIADGDYVTIEIVTGAAETGANIKAIAEWN